MEGRRRFLGIMFECCHAYGRIYKNQSATAYEGACPRCRRRVRVRIGPEGSKRRFLTARPHVRD